MAANPYFYFDEEGYITFCSSVFLAVTGKGSTRIFNRLFSFFCSLNTVKLRNAFKPNFFFISNNLQHLFIGTSNIRNLGVVICCFVAVHLVLL